MVVQGLISNASIHAGIRAPLARPIADLENDRRCGFEIITARALDRLGTAGVITQLRERVGNATVYISVDIDVLDPAFAPGTFDAVTRNNYPIYLPYWNTKDSCITLATGTPEPGGWTTRELLAILDGLDGLKVVGADVVEVAAAYDDVGETTGVAAAGIVQSLLYLMVKAPLT